MLSWRPQLERERGELRGLQERGREGRVDAVKSTAVRLIVICVQYVLILVLHQYLVCSDVAARGLDIPEVSRITQ